MTTTNTIWPDATQVKNGFAAAMLIFDTNLNRDNNDINPK
jgi:hypothetical protein